ncbi:anthranilate synthase component I [Haloglycomyces albus]|uniref:anthranilate synthase component I n=1 Tax=Haloglycomyces albus TaxID=526067 RepID=UPI00046D0FE3|nr:anthranilate synthase component I [Haloglycomyces albus]
MTVYTTAGGARITRTAATLNTDDLDYISELVESRRGGVLSSGMEYPGRYSRFHLAYVNPAAEVVVSGRTVTAQALNERGQVVLPVFEHALSQVAPVKVEGDAVSIEVPTDPGVVTEEQRSRQLTVFTALRAIVSAFGCEDPYLGLWGAFGYDLAYQFEPIEFAKERPSDVRDAVLHLADEVYVVDRKRETASLYRYDFEVDGASTVGLERTGEHFDYRPAEEVPAGPTPGAYSEVVRQAKEEFREGNLFEVVPGHEMYTTCDSPASFYERLKKSNPSPYEFFFNLGHDEYLVGTSPEMFVRVNGNRVETCPISGTIARGNDPLQDAGQILSLLNSEKEEAELTMCTDVDRNDKARVCVPGSVRVIGRRQIELYSHLIHTVDHIEGRLREDMDAFDAFLTHMWAVTVTGAPKTWAMRFIERNETTPRRWYGGAVGYVGFDGSMNTGLTLRTAHIRDGLTSVRAGATLLYYSDPDMEEAETFLKASALLEAAEGKHRMRPEPPAAIDVAGGAAGTGRRVLLIDHEDSFVNTLADYFRQHDAEVTTLRYGFDLGQALDDINPDLVVLSPGPGRPTDFACQALLRDLERRELPVFGVCLGLQAMVEYTGGKLSLLDEPAHGKPGNVKVFGGGLFSDVGDRLTTARYHSLHATIDQVQGGFVTTSALDDIAMSIEDPMRGWYGVQFHPESILTSERASGLRLIGNVLRLTDER